MNNASESPDVFYREARLFFERLIESIMEEKRKKLDGSTEII